MNLSKPLNILIDADVLCFRAALSGESQIDWGPYTDEHGVFHESNVVVELNLDKAKATLERSVKSVLSNVLKHFSAKEYSLVMCLSSKVNFRKTLYPEYKANRTKPKPALYKDIRVYCESKFNCECWDDLEGDDVLGILGTTLENTCVCSIDKDMSTIPNTVFYNIDKGTYESTNPETAKRAHLYQCLIGDSVDNYKGCPGIGPVKANKILDEDCSWGAVKGTFESKGLTENDALLQARIAKILTKDLYDAKTNTVILWTPMSTEETKVNIESEE